jgi:predicted nucleic acid-binding protein
MQKWAVQDAKARFSEFLEACISQGPQMVTKRGGCTVASTSSRCSAFTEATAAVATGARRGRDPCARRRPQAQGQRCGVRRMYLLDTNIVSELRRPRPHGGVVAWLQSVEDAELYLSAMTLGEVQAGVELTRDQDAMKAAEIEAWLDLVAQSYNVLPMDGATFRLWARLMHSRSDTRYEDAMIAATAKVHKLTVVTRNVADFTSFKVQVLNPFKKPKA